MVNTAALAVMVKLGNFNVQGRVAMQLRARHVLQFGYETRIGEERFRVASLGVV